MNKLELANYAYERECKINKYLSKLVYVDINKFKQSKLSYSVRDKLYNDYIFLKSVIRYFESNYSDYIPIFITLTLPPIFHNNNLMIRKGYNKLNNAFRSLQKTLSAYKIKYKYLRVCEPHKDLTPHFHIVLFVSDTTFAFVRNMIYRIKKKKGLGRTQVVKIDKVENTLKYVVKYLSKTLSSIYLNDLYFIKGYSSFYNIRLFTYSKLPLPRYVFKVLLSQMSDVEKKDALNQFGDYYLYLLDNVEISRDFTSFDTFNLPVDTEKKYYVKVTYDKKKIFRIKKLKFITYSDFNYYIDGGTNKFIDDFFDEFNLDPRDYYFEIDNIKIPFYSKFISDYFYFNTEIDEYLYYKDIEVYKDKELIYKKSLNFLELNFVDCV